MVHNHTAHTAFSGLLDLDGCILFRWVCVLFGRSDKYLVCVEVAGRTKNDLCVALEGNMLKVRAILTAGSHSQASTSAH